MQIAGLVARRILCYVEQGAALARGQRYGFIRFGSRVDVYLPPDAEPEGGARRQGVRYGIDPGEAEGAWMTTQRTATTRRQHRQDLAPRGLGALRRRGIYLLPNLFTTAALFFGFYAIVQAMNNRFENAAIAIFVAMVLDGLDGRVARLTHTQSEFGAQYDSLSDMVSFGAAPALVMYEWALKDMGKLGWIAAFVYCAGAALRLARFNTNIDVVDKRYFQGLAQPDGGGLRRRPGVGVRRPGHRPGAVAERDRLDLHHVRRRHHGDQRAVLQLQGIQPEEGRAVLGGGWCSPPRLAVISLKPSVVLFLHGLRLRRLGLRALVPRQAHQAWRMKDANEAWR